MTSKCVIIVEGNGFYKKINFSITLNLFSSVIIQKRCRMYNLKIIKSGDRLEIFKINNYIIKKKADEELHEPLDESIKAIQKE